ncbi:MAG: DUF1016 family protein [Nanoarchaeota archaeon]|nr:DUF1016 family protein [Nanoarchaeota archaeon]MBU4242157.1 DUF1016 family protein [Nanoarchaeota archaeon]MBU4351775.1 DUF1016 family protein [Nanoarchaeota archaeon]MBU4456665.1 DUF1016 family protein [Nanoarchaeota archaeon]MCG2719453.1 PDDEXK nuclease domain-containing protein [Nanoarchaeota archaeon]
MKKEVIKKGFSNIYDNIKIIIEQARNKTFKVINSVMVQAYWEIGRTIVEEEQKGKKRADYGKYLIKELSERLIKEYGSGFKERNLYEMRRFYLTFPKWNALRAKSQKSQKLHPVGAKSQNIYDKLSWTHYRFLMRIKKENARKFYLIETAKNQWSKRELERQINSLLYERLSLSKNKKEVKEFAKKGQIVKKPEDIIKDPYVLEFLDLNENKKYLEKDLESLLISKLKSFLLELGKGFSLVSRQKRINVSNEHYYIDLVFYNYILKCFVLIDLKVGKLSHKDIGQMDFYVRYFEKEIKQEDDNPTIGLILCSDKDDTMIKYTLLEDNDKIFASKYKLCLPTEKQLKKELTNERLKIEMEKKLKN